MNTFDDDTRTLRAEIARLRAEAQSWQGKSKFYNARADERLEYANECMTKMRKAQDALKLRRQIIQEYEDEIVRIARAVGLDAEASTDRILEAIEELKAFVP